MFNIILLNLKSKMYLLLWETLPLLSKTNCYTLCIVYNFWKMKFHCSCMAYIFAIKVLWPRSHNSIVLLYLAICWQIRLKCCSLSTFHLQDKFPLSTTWLLLKDKDSSPPWRLWSLSLRNPNWMLLKSTSFWNKLGIWARLWTRPFLLKTFL